MFREAAIMGASGGFGRLFATALRRQGVETIGVDVHRHPSLANPTDAFIVEDCARLDDAAAGRIAACDVILFCLPEAALDGAVDRLGPLLREGMLVADTTSVKTAWAARIAARELPCEWLSLNPMFAPDLGFAGQDIAAIELRSGPLSRSFCDMMERHGARVVRITAEEHDRLAAMGQIATHAAAIAYGAALSEMGFSLADMPTTPPQRALLRLAARIASLSPDVYWHMQHDNPFAPEARAAVGRALARMTRAAEAPDPEAFRALLAEVGAILGGELKAFADDFIAAERVLDGRRTKVENGEETG